MPEELLKVCREILNPSGRLILGTENRYAIKYICGDRDPYTNHNFDGIENYRRLTEADTKDIGGRCYSMAEIRERLTEGDSRMISFILLCHLLKKHSLYMQKAICQ